jgi:hypothetical protein
MPSVSVQIQSGAGGVKYFCAASRQSAVMRRSSAVCT